MLFEERQMRPVQSLRSGLMIGRQLDALLGASSRTQGIWPRCCLSIPEDRAGDAGCPDCATKPCRLLSRFPSDSGGIARPIAEISAALTYDQGPLSVQRIRKLCERDGEEPIRHSGIVMGRKLDAP